MLEEHARQNSLTRGDLQEVKRDVKELRTKATAIERQTTSTNGRVGKLETAKEVAEAVALRDRHDEEQNAKDEDAARDRQSSKNTAAWGAVYATVGLAVIYVLLELFHGLIGS